MEVLDGVDQFARSQGVTLGPTERPTVDQDRVNLFAEVIGDQQWINVDPERAPSGTIAHGLLTPSLLPHSITSGKVQGSDKPAAVLYSIIRYVP